MLIESEKRNVNNQAEIVIDTETTGITPNDNEILQLSIISATDGSTLYDGYFHPARLKNWPKAQAINSISPKMVADSPLIAEEMPKINAILANASLIIGYNTKFDCDFLINVGAIFPKRAKYVDVMVDFAPIYGEYNSYFGNFTWKKLTTCADYYEYKYGTGSDAPHGSLADCRATLHCYRAMEESGSIKIRNRP